MTEPLYEADFYSWTQQQAELIRQGRLGELDLDNILEEIESMGRSEYRQLSHRLDILLMHLLKWVYQPEHRSSSWQGSIEEQRFRIRKLIKENPGLKPKINDAMDDAYPAARISAFKETGISKEHFPDSCPWTYEQIMNEQFWPDI
ncbi:DUF29 domain-containing protein [Salinisphaera sp. G21_0]|uniref:DUF29 domain-containing protein n=1 Tax=Salinisphaera sp. G21_0 TaxID=2821094 RepID=UPI001ADC293D|nr:DUF29 domain-containing protein [Salinisphaera sp. G21_0]MBO9480305.1 DUF29 domain-containing protein [Salinisphaera sp. G21_0]